MQKIIILDFVSGKTHIFTYDPNIWMDGEEFINTKYDEVEIDATANDCQWMIVNGPLNIVDHG